MCSTGNYIRIRRCNNLRGFVAMKRYNVLRSFFLVSVVLLSLHIFCAAAQAALEGGCAKVNITRSLGVPLIGSYSASRVLYSPLSVEVKLLNQWCVVQNPV